MRKRTRFLAAFMAAALTLTSLPGSPGIVSVYADGEQQQTSAGLSWKEDSLNTNYKAEDGYTVAVNGREATVTYKSTSRSVSMYVDTDNIDFDIAALRTVYDLPSDAQAADYSKDYQYQWYAVKGTVRIPVSTSSYYQIETPATGEEVQFECEVTLNELSKYDETVYQYKYYTASSPATAKITYKLQYNGEAQTIIASGDALSWNMESLQGRYDSYQVSGDDSGTEASVDLTFDGSDESVYVSYLNNYISSDSDKLYTVYTYNGNPLTSTSGYKYSYRWYAVSGTTRVLVSTNSDYSIKFDNTDTEKHTWICEVVLDAINGNTEEDYGIEATPKNNQPLGLTLTFNGTYNGPTKEQFDNGYYQLSEYYNLNDFSEETVELVYPIENGKVSFDYDDYNKKIDIYNRYTGYSVDYTLTTKYASGDAVTKSYSGNPNVYEISNSDESGRMVASYTYGINFRYGKQLIATKSKTYKLTTDSSIVSQNISGLDKLKDSTVELNFTTSTSADIDLWPSSGNVQMQYQWIAYDADGNKVVVAGTDEGSYTGNIYNPTVYLIRSFPQADGSTVKKQVDHYVMEVTLFYPDKHGNYVKLDKITATYKVRLFLFNGGSYSVNNSNDNYDYDSQNRVVTFDSRTGEKVRLYTYARSDYVDSDDIEYQWYSVGADGKETALGVTGQNYRTKIADYTTSYKCVAVSDYLVEKFKSNMGIDSSVVITAEDYSYTFKPQKYSGYLVTDISARHQTVEVSGNAQFSIDYILDDGYQAKLQWQKATFGADGLEYKDIKDQTGKTYTITNVSEKDFVPDQMPEDYEYYWETPSHRLLVKVTADGYEKEYTYNFRLHKAGAAVESDYTIQTEQMKSYSEGYYPDKKSAVETNFTETSYNSLYDGIYLAEMGEDVTLSLTETAKDSAYQFENTWFKKDVTYKLEIKKNASGNAVFDASGNAVYVPVQVAKDDGLGNITYKDVAAGTVIPTDSYQTTEFDQESWDYDDETNKGYYGKKTVTYYKKLDPGMDTTSLTIKGTDSAGKALDIRGWYYVDVKVTKKIDGQTEPKVVDVRRYAVSIAHNSQLQAYAKGKNFKVAIGGNAELEVIADNKYGTSVCPIRYQWQKYDKKKGYVDLEGATAAKYTITGVTENSYGNYRVIVTDASGRKLTVGTYTISKKSETPVFYTPEYTYFNKSVGDSVELKVEADIPDSAKPVLYTWSKYRKYVSYHNINDGYEFDNRYWQEIKEDSETYKFTVASEEDLVTYMCEVTYLQGSEQNSATFFFNVADTSTINVEYMQPSEQYKIIGETASYAVRVAESVPVTYQWYQNGALVENATEPSWSVDKLTAKDYGTVICYVTYSEHNEPVAKRFTTNYYTDVALEENDVYVSASVGEDVTLRPELLNVTPASNLEFQWYYEGMGWINGTEQEGILYHEKAQELKLTKVGEGQFGDYRCEIRQDSILIATYQTTLSKKYEAADLVAYAEGESDDDGYLTALAGSKVTLKVVATSGKTIHYQWLRRNDYGDAKAIGGATSDTLVIDKAYSSNAGEYICEVSTAETSKKVYFNVSITSDLTVDSGYRNSNDRISYSAVLGGSVTLDAKAQVSGGYGLFYQWYRGSDSNKRLYGKTASTLELTNLTLEDLGYYTCEVTDANYVTTKLYYYVYVNTGLFCIPSVRYPEAAADGSVTMSVDATADPGQNITYRWYYSNNAESDGDYENYYHYELISGAEDPSYTIPAITDSTKGGYRVDVSTPGETNSYEFVVGSPSAKAAEYTASQDREYVEQGGNVALTATVVNPVSGANYTYAWYLEDPETYDYKKLDGNTSTLTTTVPKVRFKTDTSGYKTLAYRCYISRNGEEVKTLNYSVNVLPKVTYSSTVPETAHPFTKRLDIKGYRHTSTVSKLYVSLTEKSSGVIIVDEQGMGHNLGYDSSSSASEGRGIMLNGSSFIVIANEKSYQGYGYKLNVIDPSVASVKLADKTKIYNGAPVGIDEAVVVGSNGKVTYTYYSDQACTKALAGAPTAPGTYYVKAVVASDGVFAEMTGNVATLTIEKLASAISIADKTANYSGKSISIDAATVTGSRGAVTYTYYSDKACTNKLSGAPVNAGTYYVCATVAADDLYAAKTSSVATLTIKQVAQTITLSGSTSQIAGAKLNLKAKTTGNGTLTYATSNKSIATVSKGTVTFKAPGSVKITVRAAATTNYKAASKAITFMVSPAKVKIGTLSAGSKKLTVKWTKQTGVDGYVIEYSTSKSFTKSTTKSTTIKKAATVKTTLKSLSKKKTYYVRIRSYKKIGTKTYYGAYSDVKNKKTK